ncbi:MAG: hypothetical protein L6Q99_15685 [Planctomycetes bacterium]|nr:hypothetical protein [Planctomycetota bacterium]
MNLATKLATHSIGNFTASTLGRATAIGALWSLAFCVPLTTASAQRGAPANRKTELEQPQELVSLRGRTSLVPRQLEKAAGGRPVILLTGYWPPSNEGVRRFSTNVVQNPQGWIGSDWESRGYDVHSYFPEFVPPNCSNCGQGSGDLEVDYQDTTADFWQIVNTLQPIAIITFSRGFTDLSWELEMNQYNLTTWIGDFTAPFLPTPTPPDAGWPANAVRLSSLPVADILGDIGAAGLGLAPFIDYAGSGGGYLSEFIAYNGTWYQGLHDSPLDPAWCIAAGHVHVGGLVTWPTADAAVKVTLRSVTDYLDHVLQTPCADPVTYCTAKVNSLGCTPSLTTIGFPSVSSGSFQVRATQLRSQQPGLVIWSANAASIPFQGGTLCVAPPVKRTTPASAGGSGSTSCNGVISFTWSTAYLQQQGLAPGQTTHAQVWARDNGDPFGSSLSNAASFVWCP